MSEELSPAVLILVAIGLLFSILCGLWRVWRGPELADRLLCAQLFGTTGIALLLVLSELQALPSLRNAALALALLAVMAVVALLSRVDRAPSGKEEAERHQR